MPSINSNTLVAITALSSLTAVSLALYVAFMTPSEIERPTMSTASVDDETVRTSPTLPTETVEPKKEAKKENKKNRHPLETKDSAYEGCIYMDYNGTTPIYTEVYDSMVPYLTYYFGNPSSSHLYGPTVKRAIELARLQVAKLISCTAPYDEIIFTGCGTESDNRAIDIAIHQYLRHRQLTSRTCPESLLPEIITTPIEHPAVLCYLRHLKQEGYIKLHIVPVNIEGFVTLPEVEKALSKNTALVTIMHSNNEVGTLQPIRAISHLIANFNKRERTKILLHSDAAQSAGKIPIDVHFLGVDMLTLVGHKYGAPKGIALLYARRNTVTEIAPMLVGGGQEKGRRGGTENVPYIVGLGAASTYATHHLLENIVHLLALKLQFLSLLQSTLQLSGWTQLVKFNGPKRSVHYQQLQEDMKMLRLLLQTNQGPANNNNSSSNSNSPTVPNTSSSSSSSSSSSASSTTSPPAGPGSHHQHHVHQRAYADVLEQLPNTISVSFKGLIGHEIVSELGNKVACSAGSACHTVATRMNSAVSQPATGTLISDGDSNSLLIMRTEEIVISAPSSTHHSSSSSNTTASSSYPHNDAFDSDKNALRLSMEEKKPVYTMSEVLQAMQVSEEYGLGTVRLSFGRYTTSGEIETAVQELLRVVCAMWKKKGIIVV